MINSLVDQILRDEGEVLHAYDDANGSPVSAGYTVKGYVTIGIGRLIDMRGGGGLSQDEAIYLLTNDITKVTTQIKQHLPWSVNLDLIRFGALQAMAFNMGIENLLGFRNFLASLEAGDYPAAAAALLDSEWATQVGDRAHRLSVQVTSGEWQ
jgi:lysozyme